MLTIRSSLPDHTAPVRLHKPARAHLVGAAGCGMRSLADVLATMGWQITGSDLSADVAIDSAIEIQNGHRADRVDAGLDLVIYSDAVAPTNPEVRRARQLGVSTMSYPQMLGRLMSTRNGVAIAGTHGKSTTTAMAAEILVTAGFDPTVLFGAAPLASRSGGRLGRSRWLLAEACEYRANFRYLKPQLAAILNIEVDHVDYFHSLSDLERAFTEFARHVPREGLVVSRADCAATQRAIAPLDCACESFGLTPSATWRATALRERRGFYTFQIRCRERLVCDAKLQVAGRHNVLNALAAAALASHCGATGTAIRAGLERFAGLKRRLELVNDAPGIMILDDYAHHPTEIAAALATARQMAPGRRLWCVLQPHQASRTGRLLEEFAHSLANADKIIVARIVRAREGARRPGEVTANHLAQRVAELGRDVVHLPEADEIKNHLENSIRPGDVVITLGAGDIGNVAHELGQGLRTYRQAG
ncbi:MAG: UDP-N-acetylmuramate--L-alanine ligase [Planctomycetia bacterium]|nr:UDP-N-acetylmuramate--L-alanine ligase [Planctomycetia bacterium]